MVSGVFLELSSRPKEGNEILNLTVSLSFYDSSFVIEIESEMQYHSSFFLESLKTFRTLHSPYKVKYVMCS